MENSKGISEQRKYELKKALAVHWEIKLSLCNYKELSGFILDEDITAEDIAYMQKLQPHVEFEEKEKK